MRVIKGEENGGPGVACQRILDTTQCEFITFADADDLLMPRAIEVMHRGMVSSGYNILRSSFIKERNDIYLSTKFFYFFIWNFCIINHKN